MSSSDLTEKLADVPEGLNLDADLLPEDRDAIYRIQKKWHYKSMNFLAPREFLFYIPFALANVAALFAVPNECIPLIPVADMVAVFAYTYVGMKKDEKNKRLECGEYLKNCKNRTHYFQNI